MVRVKTPLSRAWRRHPVWRDFDGFGWIWLFADDLADDVAGSGSGVEVDEDNLLPGTECELGVDEGDGEGRAQERGADVGVAVVVVPGLFVLVEVVLGCEFFEGGGEVVVNESGFEFDGGDAGGGADVEEGDGAGGELGLGEGALGLGGDVDDVAVAAGFDINGLRFDHNGSIL